MKRTVLVVGIVCVGSAPLTNCAAPGGSQTAEAKRAERVLLLSIDGFHYDDLANWIRSNPGSALAQLAAKSINYENARTPIPSDSFPGLLALVTGGTPKATGVYYDDSYDRTLYAPGSECAISAGTQVVYDETINFDSNAVFSNGINPANLPLKRDATHACTPVYPHDFLAVNTVFEVLKAKGITAWADKHPAYDLVNGPSGIGVVDLYTPEINAKIKGAGTVNGVDLGGVAAQCDGTNSLPVARVSNFTDCIPAVEAYDDTKVQAIMNQINGRNSDGTKSQPVPVIFGMNFQAVSVGQKLPVGGYMDASGTPTAILRQAIEHTDRSIGRMVSELAGRNLLDSTMIVVTAKHGQAPIDRSKLAMLKGGSGNATVLDPLVPINTADPGVEKNMYTNNNTGGPTKGAKYAVAGHLQTDSVGVLWLQNASTVSAVAAQLRSKATAIFADKLPSDTILPDNIVYGQPLAALLGDPESSDPLLSARAPSALIQPNYGVVYSGSSKKIAEHGGATTDDTRVALLIKAPFVTAARTVSAPVTTMQVAPTILWALEVDPAMLQAVRKEGTRVLPSLQ
jgi:hypothetical protein